MKLSSTKIKSDNMIDLYELSMIYDTDQLRKEVEKYILKSRAPNYTLVNKLPKMGKKQLMIVITDFFLKGTGLGVIK
jgi:hypothetical protein